MENSCQRTESCWSRGNGTSSWKTDKKRIITKYIKAPAAGSWEGNVLEEAVKGGAVKFSALALAMAFVPSKTGFLSVN